MSDHIISYCIGQYEAGDHQCDGNPAAGSSGDKTPCGWRGRCVAFTRHIAKAGKTPADYVEWDSSVDEDGKECHYAIPKKGMAHFERFCDALIKAEMKKQKQQLKKGKKRGRKPTVDKRRAGPTKKAKNAAKLALAKRREERRKRLAARMEKFLGQVEEKMNGALGFSQPGQVLAPGQMYVVDRLQTSGYVAIYCKAARGLDLPLFSIRHKLASLSYDVSLPVEMKQLESCLSASTLKKLKFVEVKDGRFKSLSPKVGKEHLMLMAETIAELVIGGNILLPVI